MLRIIKRCCMFGDLKQSFKRKLSDSSSKMLKYVSFLFRLCFTIHKLRFHDPNKGFLSKINANALFH